MTEARSTFLVALDTARQKIGLVLEKDSTGHYSKYTSLPEILRKVDGPLRETGLILTNRIDSDPFRLVVTLEHVESGYGESASFVLPENQPPEKVGAAISYFRRYGIGVLIGFATDSDVDSVEYQQHKQSKPEPAPAKTETPTGSTNPYMDALNNRYGTAQVIAACQTLNLKPAQLTKRQARQVAEMLQEAESA